MEGNPGIMLSEQKQAICQTIDSKPGRYSVTTIL